MALDPVCSRSSAFVFKSGAISKEKLHINTAQLSGLNHNQPESHLQERAAAGTGLGGHADRQVQLLPAPFAAQLREAVRARQLLQEGVHIGHIHKYTAVTGEWLLKVGPVRRKKQHRTPHSDLCPKTELLGKHQTSEIN